MRIPKGSAGFRLTGRDGFTLVEALAAFAIVAILTLVVQRGLVQSRQGLAAVEDRITAERVARSLLAAPLTRADVEAGARSGTVDGHPYEMRLSPLALPLPEGPPPTQAIRWKPFRQEVSVATRRGAIIAVETIRLGPVY